MRIKIEDPTPEKLASAIEAVSSRGRIVSCNLYISFEGEGAEGKQDFIFEDGTLSPLKQSEKKDPPPARNKETSTSLQSNSPRRTPDIRPSVPSTFCSLPFEKKRVCIERLNRAMDAAWKADGASVLQNGPRRGQRKSTPVLSLAFKGNEVFVECDHPGVEHKPAKGNGKDPVEALRAAERKADTPLLEPFFRKAIVEARRIASDLEKDLATDGSGRSE